MMIKKHVLTSQVIFFKEDFLEFDYNMVLNSHITSLQTYHELQACEHPIKHIDVLSFNSYADDNSLYDLIKMKQFNLNRLKTLLGQIEILERELESYLLDINKVNFDPAYVIFDEVKQRFLFRYLPCKNLCFTYDILALCRFIAFETTLIDHALLGGDITFSLSNVIDQTTTKEQKSHFKNLKLTKNQSDKFIWWHKSKKESLTVSTTPPNTTQRMTYPLLFDKSNPDLSIKVFFDHNIIGREETCNIRIDDVSISRQHAQLINIKNQFKLIDLNSTNGTYVNREPIDEKMVVNGDIIQIGNKEFIFIR